MTRGERPRRVQHHWIQDVVAENLRDAMDRDGRSAQKLGDDARVGRKSVERLRDGKNSTLTTLGAVADALGMASPVELLLVRQRTRSSSEPAVPVASLPGYPKMLDAEVKKIERKVRDRKKRTR